MVKTYSKQKDGPKQLTPHFRVEEFACKDGTDKILIDEALPVLLEQMRAYLGCSKINIRSGYRTESHNKSVGGSPTSKHLLGKAADIICFDQAGARIDAKRVCCAAQDLNHPGGCSYVNDTTAHLDTRETRYWFDETKRDKNGNYISTNDFYAYFGFKKTNPYPKPTTALKRGSKGNEVKWLQTELNARGTKLAVDGSFGPATDAAVRAFQKSKGLVQDGHVGPLTRKALGIY